MEIVKQYEDGKLYLANGIRIVDIRGDWFTMGRQYGCLAKENLQHVFDFLKEETKSQRDEETKRQRDEETKSHRDEETKRRRKGARRKGNGRG